MSKTRELGAKGPSSVVTAGPWSARDSFVAETAVVLDRLTAKIERLERREEALKAQVNELLESAQQANRLQALAESLRNSRDYKLDEMIRLVKDVRQRVAAIEGPRADYNTLTYKSFIAVDRKLVELAEAHARPARPFGRLQMSGLAVGFLAATVLASFVQLVFLA